MLYVHTHPILSITKISYFLTITTYNKHSKKYFYNTPNLEVGGHYECCGKLKMIDPKFQGVNSNCVVSRPISKLKVSIINILITAIWRFNFVSIY